MEAMTAGEAASGCSMGLPVQSASWTNGALAGGGWSPGMPPTFGEHTRDARGPPGNGNGDSAEQLMTLRRTLTGATGWGLRTSTLALQGKACTLH